MNDPLSSADPGSGLPPFRLSRRSLRGGLLAPVLAVFATLQCASLQAEEIDQVDAVARANVVSAPQSPVSWMSGGIGDEARDDMRKAAAGYNVHLVFSDRQGAYLANIPFCVSRPDGREIQSGVSEGPLLYLQLPPGAYQIAAMIDGTWQSRRIQAGTSPRSVRMSFIARGD